VGKERVSRLAGWDKGIGRGSPGWQEGKKNGHFPVSVRWRSTLSSLAIPDSFRAANMSEGGGGGATGAGSELASAPSTPLPRPRPSDGDSEVAATTVKKRDFAAFSAGDGEGGPGEEREEEEGSAGKRTKADVPDPAVQKWVQAEVTGEMGCHPGSVGPPEEMEGAQIEKKAQLENGVAGAAKLQFESAGNDVPGMSSPLDEQAPCANGGGNQALMGKHSQDATALQAVGAEAENSVTTIPGNAGSQSADGEKEERVEGGADVEAQSQQVGEPASMQVAKKPLQCSKCAQPFCPTANKPMLLPCLHSFCAGCVSAPGLQGAGTGEAAGTEGATGAGGRANKFWCHLCNKAFPQAMENQALAASVATSLFAQHGKVVCGDCGEEAGCRNGVYCRECCKCLCSFCAAHHQRALVTKQHSTRTIEDMQGLVRSAAHSGSFPLGEKSFCSTHPREENEFYCTHCARVVCAKCAIVDHDNHHRLPIAESAERFKTTELEGWLSAVEARHSRLEQAEAHLAAQVPCFPHPAPCAVRPRAGKSIR
jgi:hypothetical protein